MQDILNIDLGPYMQMLYDNINFENVLKFVIIYFFIIRISLIIWVIKDIINRSGNIFFQMFCILLITVWTPLSVFLYLLIRPGRTLYEKYQDEVEDNLDIMQEMIEDKNKHVWNSFKYVVVVERDSTMLRHGSSWINHGKASLYHSGS